MTVAVLPVRVRGLASVFRREERRNLSWLLVENAFRLVIAGLTDVAIARYLAPEGFGDLQFSVSTVSLCGALVGFGFAGLAVRDLVQTPEKRDEIIGTVIALRFAGALLVLPLTMLSVLALRTGNGEVVLITAVLSTAAVLRSFDSVDYLLQAELRARQAGIARIAALAAASAISLLLIIMQAPLVMFAVALATEFAVAALSFSLIYARLGYSPRRWRFSLQRAKYMVVLVWPAFLGGAAATINLRIDQVMLGAMTSSREVGLYAAAARLSEVWYMLPAAIATTVFPGLILARDSDPEAYRRRLQDLYKLLAWFAIGLAVLTTLAGGLVVRLLFGASYEPAAAMLAVHIWACPFIFTGALLGRWLVSESMFGLSAFRHGFGAATNIGLNLVLIPKYGGVGAAWATLISYGVANYLACFTSRATLEQGRMMTLAVLEPFRIVMEAARLSSVRFASLWRSP